MKITASSNKQKNESIRLIKLEDKDALIAIAEAIGLF